MSFIAGLTVSATSDPSSIVLTDTSVGSDTNLTSRSVSLFKSDGSLYSPVITWALAQSSLTLPILTQDIALNISVLWNSSSPLPPPSVYLVSTIVAFNGYGKAFDYYLTQLQTSSPSIIQDKNYYQNRMILRVELDSSQNVLAVNNNLGLSQACIDRYNYLISNKTYYF